VYVGPRTRQRQTAELVGAAYSQAGVPWPAPVELPELDEYDIAGLMHQVAPELARRDPAFAALLAQHHQSTDAALRLWSFQKAFETLTQHWMTAADALAGLETWPMF